MRLPLRQAGARDRASRRQRCEREPVLHQFAGMGVGQLKREMPEALIEPAFPFRAHFIAGLQNGPHPPPLPAMDEPRPAPVGGRKNVCDRMVLAMRARRENDALVNEIHIGPADPGSCQMRLWRQ